MAGRRYGDDEVREIFSLAATGDGRDQSLPADGKPGKALVVLAMFVGMALATFGTNLVRLPLWARERKRQMETIAERAVKLLSDDANSP